MKTCSKCHRTFDDRVAFCLHDGMPLTVVAESGAALASPGSGAQAVKDVSSEDTFVSKPNSAKSAAPSATAPYSAAARAGAGTATGPTPVPQAVQSVSVSGALPSPSAMAGPFDAPGGGEGRTPATKPRIRPAPVLQTGVLKALPAVGTPGAPRFNPLAPATAPTPSQRSANEQLGPNLGRRLELIPHLKPVLSTRPPTPTLGVKPHGESAHQLPPWELPVGEQPALQPKPEPVIASPAPQEVALPAEDEHELVITPDLPEPPQIRAEATPVGDETVLELQEDDTPELVLEPEAPPPPPPPAVDEVPLERRYTRKSAVPRAVPTPLNPTPPVDDESEADARQMYILSDDDPDPPKVGVDLDSDAHLLNPYRIEPKKVPQVEDETSVGQGKPVWLIVAAAALVLALGVAAYLVVGGTSSEPRGSGSSGNATAVEPGSTTVVKLTPNGQSSQTTLAASPAPAKEEPTPVIETPVPATPTPVAAAQVQPPVQAVSVPAPVPRNAPVAAVPPAPVPVAAKTPTPKPVVKAEPPPRTPAPTPRPSTPRTESAPVRTPPPAAPAPAPTAAEGPVKLIILGNALGAEVYVDGQKVGTLPATTTLSPGPHAIKVVPSDKPAQERSVDVGRGVGPERIQREKFSF